MFLYTYLCIPAISLSGVNQRHNKYIVSVQCFFGSSDDLLKTRTFAQDHGKTIFPLGNYFVLIKYVVI